MGRKRKTIELSGELDTRQEERVLVERKHRTKNGRLVSDFFWSLLGQGSDNSARSADCSDAYGDVMEVDQGAEILDDSNGQEDALEEVEPIDFWTYEHDIRNIEEEKRATHAKISQDQRKVSAKISVVI